MHHTRLKQRDAGTSKWRSHLDDDDRRELLNAVQKDHVLHTLMDLSKVEPLIKLHGEAFVHDRCLFLGGEENHLGQSGGVGLTGVCGVCELNFRDRVR